ncbi:MAG: hypothetical protein EBY57_09110 [Actinobacteria bacterium]|nr:hypothetical protein [Actinomycetota bacterium]
MLITTDTRHVIAGNELKFSSGYVLTRMGSYLLGEHRKPVDPDRERWHETCSDLRRRVAAINC